MSLEEWRAFHKKPTMGGLTPELVQNDSQPGICCRCVWGVFRKHFIGDGIGYVKRIRELGYHIPSHYICHVDIIIRPNAMELIIATGITLTEELYWYVVIEYHNNVDCGRLLMQLEDRGVSRGGQVPLFIKTFAVCRVWAKFGAILTLRALRVKLGKDVALMIARVVWEMRKFYISSSMMDENAMKRIKI